MYVSYLKLRSHQSAWLMFLWCLLMVVCLFALPAKVHAVSIFEVNLTIFDAVDMNPGDGVCKISPSTDSCTLRAAVMEANANPGADIITLPKGAEIRLSIPPQGFSASAADGDLNVTESLVVMYGGSNQEDYPLINASGMGDRVFHISEGNFALTHVRIRGGSKSFLSGGAIYISSGTDSATLTEVELFSNNARSGGAIHNILSELTIVDSSIHHNAVSESASAIDNYCGNVTIERTSIYQNNNFGTHGESIRNTKSESAGTDECRLNLRNSSVLESSGMGILNRGGYLNITSSTIAKNGQYGIRMEPDGANTSLGELRMRNSALAQNNPSNCQLVGIGWNTNGYNASDDSSCSLAAGSTNVVVDDLRLLAPSNHSGSWQRYMSPSLSSALVDEAHPVTGGVGCPEDDQLGNPRPKQGSLGGSERCDIGSVERQNSIVLPQPSSIFRDGFETQDGD